MKTVLLSFIVLIFCAFDGQYAEFQKFIRDKDHDKRIRAIKSIQDMQTEDSTRLIAGALTDQHHKVRYRAVQALAGIDDKQSMQWLIHKGMKSKHFLIRAGIAEAFGMMSRSEEIVQALIDALNDQKLKVRYEVVDALMKLGAKNAFEFLAKRYEREREALVKAAILLCCVSLSSERSSSMIEEAATHRAYQLRMAAAACLAQSQLDRAFQLIPTMLQDKDWRVRAETIRACVNVSKSICVEYLIQRLPQEKGRLRWDILVALDQLTGKRFGLDVKKWEQWWDQSRATFQTSLERSAAKGKKKQVRKGSTEVEIFPESEQMAFSRFLTLPILSNRVAFVLDLSGSMKDKVRDPVTKKRITRLDLAKKEMIKTIASFPENVYFNIFLLGSNKEGMYNKAEKIWMSSLMPSVRRNKVAASRFISKQVAKGWTNIYDALELAFNDPNVDTIYLFSDGDPTKGVFVSIKDIIHHVNKYNRFRRITIHTIELEASAKGNKRFMRELAEATGGVYLAK